MRWQLSHSTSELPLQGWPACLLRVLLRDLLQVALKYSIVKLLCLEYDILQMVEGVF